MSSVGDIVEIDVNYTGPSGRLQNTFGFLCVTNVSNGLQNLADAFYTAMVKNTSGGLLYPQSNQINSASLFAQDVVPATAATYVKSYSAVAGADAGDPLPWQIAALFSLRTDLKGRAYRGRLYLPGMPENSTTAGVFVAGSITALTTIKTQLLAVFGPGGTNGDWRLSIISRYLNGAKRATPVATQVTSIAIDNVPRTQRRRVIGVGA